MTNKQTTLVSRYDIHAAGLKSILNLSKQIIIKPYVGYQYSKNIVYMDWGYDMGVDGTIDHVNIGDYRTNLSLSSDYDLFPERVNSSNQFNLRIKKRFSSLAEDSLKINYLKSKQQYYSFPSGKIVDLALDSKNLQNTLNYNMSPHSLLQVRTILIDRKISDNTPNNPNVRKMIRFENHFGYQYFSPEFLFRIGLNTFLETLDNKDIVTDSEALQTAFITDFSFFLNSNNQLDLQLNFIKYQFDTPDVEVNFDDRDEIRFVGLGRYIHRFSTLLSMETEIYINLYHKTYIYKQQSINNNWNRIYRLQSSVNYTYNDFQNILHTQVLANYTAYDFDQLFENTQSYLFRKYSVSDSLVTVILPYIYGGFYVRLELEERGNFYKELFAQNIAESSQILYYDFFLRKEGFFRLNLETGIAVYHRKNWRHLTVTVETRDISRLSPYLKLVYPLGENLQLSSQITQNYLVDQGREKSQYTYGKLDFNYFF